MLNPVPKRHHTVVVTKDATLDHRFLVTLDGQNKSSVRNTKQRASLALRGPPFFTR